MIFALSLLFILGLTCGLQAPMVASHGRRGEQNAALASAVVCTAAVLTAVVLVVLLVRQ